MSATACADVPWYRTCSAGRRSQRCSSRSRCSSYCCCSSGCNTRSTCRGGRQRGYSETLSSPGAARAELSPVLEVRVRGNRTTPVLLCPAANISRISPLDTSHLDEAPGGTGGLPGRPAGGQTQPLARAQHSCAGLHREKLSQVSTLGTGLPSQHQVMPPLWPPTSSTRKTKVTRPPDSGGGANSGAQRVSKLVYLVSAEGCRRIIYP